MYLTCWLSYASVRTVTNGTFPHPSVESSPLSSDDEFGGKPTRRRAAKRSRQSSAVEYERISSRNGKKIPNYNEENMGLALSDDDPFEDAADRQLQNWAAAGGVFEGEQCLSALG